MKPSVASIEFELAAIMRIVKVIMVFYNICIERSENCITTLHYAHECPESD